jgi:hypothetical protein
MIFDIENYGLSEVTFYNENREVIFRLSYDDSYDSCCSRTDGTFTFENKEIKNFEMFKLATFVRLEVLLIRDIKNERITNYKLIFKEISDLNIVIRQRKRCETCDFDDIEIEYMNTVTKQLFVSK